MRDGLKESSIEIKIVKDQVFEKIERIVRLDKEKDEALA